MNSKKINEATHQSLTPSRWARECRRSMNKCKSNGGGCPLLGRSSGHKALQPWDDFLEFSRLMSPRVGWHSSIVQSRFRVNIKTFALNYVIFVFLGMVFLGSLLFNKRTVFASSLVAAVYHLRPLLTATAPAHLMMPTTKEAGFMMFAIGNLVYYWLSVWRIGILLASILGLLVLGHAIGRPVPGELEAYRNSEEETVEFDIAGATARGNRAGSEQARGDHIQHGGGGGLYCRRRPRPMMAVPGTAIKMTCLGLAKGD